MVDGKPHRLSYMAQVVKIVVALKDLAKKVRGRGWVLVVCGG